MTPLPQTVTLWLSLLAVAASSDVASRRIPNATVVLVAALGLLVRLGDGGVKGAATSILAAVGVSIPLLFAWRKGFCGGGDVKLLAAAACGVGAARLPEFAIATALAGGSLALAVLVFERAARSAVRATAAGVVLGTGEPRGLAREWRPSVPYGAAIAMGAAYALLSGRTA